MRFPRLAGAIRDVAKSTWLKETVLALPRVAMLIPKLLSDKRVPARTKASLLGLSVYLVSPWDIIPDFIPGLGQLDDAVVALLLVDGILNQVNDEVLVEHWTGEIETLRRVQDLSRAISHWTPRRVKDYLFNKAVSAGDKD
jgi:uncharacterized membrane protein YkvA (DUF1232 family)